MSLRSKIVLALGLVAVLWAVVDNVLLRTMVTTHFDELTERTAMDALLRAEAELATDVDEVRRAARTLVASEPVRTAVRAGDRAGLERLTATTTLTELDLDLLLVLDEDGAVLRYHARDAEGNAVAYRRFPTGAVASTNPLLKQPEATRFGSVLPTEHGFLLACAYALPLDGVLEAPGEDLDTLLPAPTVGQGAVLAGRLLSSVRSSEAFGHPSRVVLTDTVRSEPTPDQVRALAELDSTTIGGDRTVAELEDEGIGAFRLLEDLEGKPTLLLQAELTPDALLEGRRVQQFLALSTVGTSTLIFLVLLRLLQRVVIAPLSALTAHAVEVGRTDDTTRRLALERSDEVGQLSVEFDRMLDKLEESRRLLVVSARQAGMSEIATGVLHNVGNVLNSVNVSRGLIERKLEALVVADLARVVEVLRQHEHDLGRFIAEDPRGRNLLPFLDELSRTLVAQHRDVVAEAENLRKSVDHVADLVRSQQAYAGSKGVFERTSLATEIENALKISGQAHGQGSGLEIVRELADVPLVSVDRHKLMEILINLIQNAKQALAASGVRPARLTIGLDQDEHGTVRLSVRDNGEGIPRENLTRIFGHGFTTKKDGHGFGLHASANAATEMGARLEAYSDGPGTGATFVLSFPREAAGAASAAA